MAEELEMLEGKKSNEELRFMLDPYMTWVGNEGIPIHDGFCLNLHELETGAWPRLGANGAAVHLQGRGDFMSLFLYDLPAGGKTAPQQHLYEEIILVLEGHGSTVIETLDGSKQSIEWGPDSLFAIPLNARYQLFNGSGSEKARLVSATDLPVTMNAFHQEDFIFDNPVRFPEREGKADWFGGEGEYVPAHRNQQMWITNFVSDLKSFELFSWEERGAGSATVQFCLADGVLHAHCSEMTVGTYKKAHRHPPDAHVFVIDGEGYSLFWYEGDDDFTRHDWKHGTVFAPDGGMFHQHFNTSPTPVRYFATMMGSSRYPFTQERFESKLGINLSVKEGGCQIEYEDQDPRVHRMYLEALEKNGVECRMGEFIDASTLPGNK